MTMDLEARYLSEPGGSGLFTRLARVGLLIDAFQHRCLDRFELLFIDYSVLRVLQLAPAPHTMSPSELSEVVLRSTGGMTQILDRLEGAGLIAREADPSDRRKVVVRLTEDGLRTATRASESYREERERVLAPLSEADIEHLDGAVHRLLEVLHEQAIAARAPGRT